MGGVALQIWPRVHNQIVFCLILAQLVLVFILAIKKVGIEPLPSGCTGASAAPMLLRWQKKVWCLLTKAGGT